MDAWQEHAQRMAKVELAQRLVDQIRAGDASTDEELAAERLEECIDAWLCTYTRPCGPPTWRQHKKNMKAEARRKASAFSGDLSGADKVLRQVYAPAKAATHHFRNLPTFRPCPPFTGLF